MADTIQNTPPPAKLEKPEPAPTVRLTPDASIALDRLAENLGIPKNAIVSNLIIEVLAAAEGTESMPFITFVRERISSTRPAA